MPKQLESFSLWHTLLYFLVFVFLIIAYMIINGALNYKRIAECKNIPSDKFCGLKIIDLASPDYLNSEIMNHVSNGAGKRIVIPGWKAGRTITTNYIKHAIPNLFEWYNNLETQISDIIGEKVFVTGSHLPTTCAILIYEDNDDFINWHYDVNYFNGRFFTLLIPVTITNTCTKYTYYDKDDTLRQIQEEREKAILFEGDKVFHMATKFCNKGQKRVVISVQFSTDPTISWYNNFILRLKDIAYIGY